MILRAWLRVALQMGGRLLRLLTSLSLLALSGGLFLALWSFHPLDGSFNSAADTTVQNWMGSLGAYSADGLRQFLGWASYGVPFLCARLGFFYRGSTGAFPAAVVMTGIVCLLTVSFGLTAFWPRAGGALGLLGLLWIPALQTPVGYSCVWTLALLTFTLLFPWQSWVRWFWERCFFWMPCFAFLPKIQRPSFLKGWASVPDFEFPQQKPAPAPRKNGRKPSLRKAEESMIESGAYTLPPLDLLKAGDLNSGKATLSAKVLEQQSLLLLQVLDDFGIKGQIVAAHPGPVVTLYELEPAAGLKSSRVIGLADDIARSMSAISARVAVVPGRNVIGIELPNPTREGVLLRPLLEAMDPQGIAGLSLALGKDISGKPIVADLTRMPHLLVAGTTGSGKSVGINGMILSLIYRMPPEKCRFIMIDPKMLELSVYDGIPHLLAPVVTEPKKAVVALKWVVREMENRYRAMSQLGVRNIDGYNQRIREAQAQEETVKRTVQTGFDDEGKPLFEEQAFKVNALPFIVVIVDEMADLMLVAGKEIESAVQRLAQMARAAGIHLIMATQRPSVDVITGTIKANFPTRISFQVTSKIDSRTILSEQGAEQLLGQGDMLYMAAGGRIVRVHGPFVSDQEVEKVVHFLKSQGEPSYVTDLIDTIEGGDLLGSFGGSEDGGDGEDALYRQAVEIVKRHRKASTSYIQRQLQIGYNRAARLVERMETEGLVSSPNHVGKRDIFMDGDQ
jgi:S-DNA-T family DNA segregation ATPase FtsK/SpoIIIE